jgi:hypothetical protein
VIPDFNLQKAWTGEGGLELIHLIEVASGQISLVALRVALDLFSQLNEDVRVTEAALVSCGKVMCLEDVDPDDTLIAYEKLLGDRVEIFSVTVFLLIDWGECKHNSSFLQLPFFPMLPDFCLTCLRRRLALLPRKLLRLTTNPYHALELTNGCDIRPTAGAIHPIGR